jgi:hypothetical protein
MVEFSFLRSRHFASKLQDDIALVMNGLCLWLVISHQLAVVIPCNVQMEITNLFPKL